MRPFQTICTLSIALAIAAVSLSASEDVMAKNQTKQSEAKQADQNQTKQEQTKQSEAKQAGVTPHVPDYGTDGETIEDIQASVGTGVATEEGTQQPKPKHPERILRPSDIPTEDEEGKPIGDVHRFLRERGLPNPQRLYRVSANGKNADKYKPLEINAVDEGDAVRQFCRMHSVKKTHTLSCRTVVLEE